MASRSKPMGATDPGQPNMIEMYVHCSRCLEVRPPDQSPSEWAQLEVGVTHHGAIQVWCKRHECNVVLIDCAMLNAMIAHASCAVCDDGKGA